MICSLILIGNIWVNNCNVSYLEMWPKNEEVCKLYFPALGSSGRKMEKSVKMSCDDVAEKLNNG